jgi:Fe-S oxidoreductase
LRALIGLPVKQDIVTPAAISQAPAEQPTAFHDHKHLTCSISDHDAEILALFEGKGLKKERFKVLETNKMFFSSIEEMVKEELFAEYTLNEIQKKIVKEIQKDANVTIPQIAKAVGIDEASVIGRINTLLDDNVIVEKISREGLITRNVTKTGEAAIKRLEPVTSFRVLYSYEERKNVPDAISGSRPLCERLYNSGLYFTREEIQNISNQLGYSVFQLCGGWYRNPNTGRTTPYCRHEWVRNVVIEKTSR